MKTASRMLGCLVLLALAAMVGCQGQSKKSSNAIYLNIGGEPTTLNPLTATDGFTSSVHAYIFESLLTNDVETWNWKPALATEWTISKDKRVFEFKLRQGVKWHDGVEFTAEDVKFSFDVIYTEDFKAVHLRTYYDSIKSVEILDKYSVRFTVKDDYFQNFDFCAGIKVLPKHFYTNPANKKDLNKKVLGTGPYMFTKYDKGQKIILVKNPDWWGMKVDSEKNTNITPKIVLKFSSEENVSLELLKKGDIDFLGLRPEGYVKKTVGKVWEDKIVKVQTENKTPKNYSFIGFNLKKDVFKDVRVRKALSLLLNRPMMAEKFEYELAVPASGPVYIQSDYANPDVKAIPYDPQAALKLLGEAGWKDSDKDGILDKTIGGKKSNLSFTILEPLQDFMKYLTVFKEDASKVGVDIQLKTIEWNSFIKLIDERNFEAVRLAWSGGSVDWDPKQVWHSSSASNGGSNFVSYKNPKVDKLIDEARKSYDKQKRIDLLRQVHAQISEDCPYIFFFNQKYTLYGHTKRIVKPKDTFTYGIGTEYWTIK